VDTASPQSGDLALNLPSMTSTAPELPTSSEIPDFLANELWKVSQGEAVGLTILEFRSRLTSLGAKHNYNLPSDRIATMAEMESFLRGLHLADVALAYACALGRDEAWNRFLSLYRAPLVQVAIAITGSATLGHELAGSLHSELYGLTEKDGQRSSPLVSYSGRGSLIGWLRTTVAQRYIDHHRHTHRESPLESIEPETPALTPAPSPTEIGRLQEAVKQVLIGVSGEDRFLLASYYLDQRTLQQIAQLMRVHEATVSRKLKRLATDLRKRLLKHLQAYGLSKRAAEEALSIDSRDLTIDLRKMLQTSASQPFSNQTVSTKQNP
jgi:RNA polymerase sigma-70 factor (ECF subfamily)